MEPNRLIRLALWLSRYRWSVIAIGADAEQMLVIGRATR